MAGRKGTVKIKQRETPAAKRQAVASATRKRREEYFARKKFALGREPENFQKICVVEYEEGWWRMFDHSALLYKHVVGNQLNIDVRIHPDEDHGCKEKAKHGVAYIRSCDSLKDKMKRAKARQVWGKDGVMIFALPHECAPEKMRIYEEYEEDRWAQVNKLILPKESMPGLKAKMREVAEDVYRIVHKMGEDARDCYGTELAQMSGKLLSDFLLMANGHIDKLDYLNNASRVLQELKAKVGVVTELRVVQPGKVFLLLKNIEKTIKQVEIERRIATPFSEVANERMQTKHIK